MENNANYQTVNDQQPVQQYYYTPGYRQSADPNYANTVKEFLIKAIVACAISSLPIGSIIAIFMGSKNRAAILDYLSKGGLHTIRIKVCSCLSRAAKYAGIAYTILWAVYLLYLAFVLFIIIAAVIGTAVHK